MRSSEVVRGTERDRDDERARRAPSPAPDVAAVLGLQRGAGNAATAALLARQPVRTGPKPGFGDRPRTIDPGAPQPAEPSGLAYPLPASVPGAAMLNPFLKRALDARALAFDQKRSLDRLRVSDKDATDFVAGHAKSVESEVASNQTAEVREVARDMEQQRQILELAYGMVGHLKLEIESAQAHVASARKRLAGIEHLDEAKRLSDKAAAWDQDMNTTLARFGSVIEFTVAIGTHNPAGAIKPLWDLFASVVSANANNPFKAGAKAQYRKGTDLAIQAAWEDIDAATATIAGAAKLVEQRRASAQDSARDFEEMRSEAEDLYDASTTGGFTFKALRKQIAWAQTAMTIGGATAERFESARFHADALQTAFRAPGAKAELGQPGSEVIAEGLLTARDWVAEHAREASDARTFAGRAEAMLGSLATMRNAAGKTMARTRPPRPKQP
jgi:hypothetical protein